MRPGEGRRLTIASALAAAALALQSPPPADAARWVELNRNPQRIAFYDAAGLARSGDLVRFTLRFDLALPDEGATRRFHDTEVDCARRTVRMLSGVDRDDSGRIVRTLPVPPDLVLHQPIPAGPGPGEQLLALICR